MSLDNTLWMAGILAEAFVVGLLIYRRVWRLLPLFCVYCIWDMLSNAEGFATAHMFDSTSSFYLTTYLIQTVDRLGPAVLRAGGARLVCAAAGSRLAAPLHLACVSGMILLDRCRNLAVLRPSQSFACTPAACADRRPSSADRRDPQDPAFSGIGWLQPAALNRLA